MLLGSASAYTTEIVDIPMRDDILLKSTIYKPYASIFPPPWPSIISRSVYGMTFAAVSQWTDVYGYVVIGQWQRGYGESQGIATAFRTDGWGDCHYGDLRDGYDAIEWIASQPWSNGKVSMYGFSGPGLVQYQAAGAQPPHLVCCNAACGFLDYYHDATWPGGEFRKACVEGWCTMFNTPYIVDTICDHPNEDTFYLCHNLATRWDSAHYPMFHFGGWFDINLEGALTAFSGLQAHHHNQKLFIGPWGHWTWGYTHVGDLYFPPNAWTGSSEFRALDKAWYDYWMYD